LCPFPNNLIIPFTISPQQNLTIPLEIGQVNPWVDRNGSSELNFQQTKVNTWVDGNGSSELNFQQTKVNTWVDGNGSSELNFQQTKVNTWVDGNGSSELNFQQTKVNTWVDGYSCSECHSTSKPGCFIGTSVSASADTLVHQRLFHQHISTLINEHIISVPLPHGLFN
jgi:ribonuclease PH